jgi:excisionase family DNA binding protein
MEEKLQEEIEKALEEARKMIVANNLLLNIAQAAGYLSTSERHIRHMVSKREIEVVRIGNKVRLRIGALDQYQISKTTPAKAVQ